MVTLAAGMVKGHPETGRPCILIFPFSILSAYVLNFSAVKNIFPAQPLEIPCAEYFGRLSNQKN